MTWSVQCLVKTDCKDDYSKRIAFVNHSSITTGIEQVTQTALVLAGHGSHISPETAGFIWEQVDKLRCLGIADEVTATFWKEMPSFSTVFNSLSAHDITVVPMFTAQGYFTQTVIPAEMGLTGSITQRDGKTIRYARTLSEHPYLFGVVECRVREALGALKSLPQETAVAIIGHSTRRNPESRQATEAQAQAVRKLGLACEVVAVYLDDEPEIQTVYELTSAPNLIAVPFFLAMGSHTTIDVPQELGLTGGQPPEQVKGRHVYYTRSVGVDNDWSDVVMVLAREAGMTLKPARAGSAWDGFPSRVSERFWADLAVAGYVKLGQLRLTPDEVRHWDDHSANGLKTINDVGALRRFVREKPFRSLATSADLPRGWRIAIDGQPERLRAVVETIYPGVLADWESPSQLKVNTFDATIARQTGNYRQLKNLAPHAQETVVHQVCGNCVRHPTWFHGASPVDAIPCPEPCNHWLSAALRSIAKDETT
jgi:sirohydrochlorin cobaltochelatase